MRSSPGLFKLLAMAFATWETADTIFRKQPTSGFGDLILIVHRRLIPRVEGVQAPSALVARHFDALSHVKALAVELGCDHIVFEIHTPARDALVDASVAVVRGRRRDGDALPGVGLVVAGRQETVGRHEGPRQPAAGGVSNCA